jgi:hypothetical protein
VTVDIDLDSELFLTLGSLTSAPRGPFWPWDDVATPPTDEQRGQLVTAAVLDGNGRVPGALQVTLSALAAASAKTSIHFYGGGAAAEFANYLAPGRNPVALTSSRVGGVRLQDPAPVDLQIQTTAELIGWSTSRGVELELEIPTADALVLAALIDLERRQSLLELAGGGSSSGRPVDFDALSVSLREPGRGLFWLVNAVARRCGTEPSSAAAAVPDAVRRLTGRGVIDATETTAVLVGASKELATRFLTVVAILDLDNELDNGHGDVASVGFTCVQAGIHDLITIENLERGVHLETLSAATLINYAELFIRQPNYAALPVATTARFVATHLIAPGGRAPTWAQPNTASGSLAGVSSGTAVRLVSEESGWAEVESAGGWQGWLDRRWLEDLPPRVGPSS